MTKIGTTKYSTQELDVDNEYGDYVSDNEDGLQRLADADRKKYVGIAMQKLNQKDQLIITLYYIADKSVTEITEIMDMQPSAIKMRLLRSRKQLERELKLLLDDEINEL